MITTRLRRRAAAVVLSLTAVLATSAATLPADITAKAPTAFAAKAAAPTCPQFADPVHAAAVTRAVHDVVVAVRTGEPLKAP